MLSWLLADAGGGVGGAPAGSLGGAGGSYGDGATCAVRDDVLVSCEEGYGGAYIAARCTPACDACMVGAWAIDSSPIYTREDCLWTCDNGKPTPGHPL